MGTKRNHNNKSFTYIFLFNSNKKIVDSPGIYRTEILLSVQTDEDIICLKKNLENC